MDNLTCFQPALIGRVSASAVHWRLLGVIFDHFECGCGLPKVHWRRAVLDEGIN